MISFGTNIINTTESLRKINLIEILDRIKKTKNIQHIQFIQQLRTIKQIDEKRYAELKRKLPYIVCGIFNPAFRRTDNFAYTEYFIVDIDHLADKGYDINEIKETLSKDSEILAIFTSPGNDGLKVILQLKDRCYDAGLYRIFYKQYAYKFGVRHNIEQAIDTKVCDVTRACFVSYDPNLYYNPTADKIDINIYVDTNNPEELFNNDKIISQLIVPQSSNILQHNDPCDDSLATIKEILLPKRQKKNSKTDVYVPPLLNEIIDGLVTSIEQSGINVTEVINIQYGKKLRMKWGIKLAETNIFYGKRGFSVVQSPRAGTDGSFNEIMSEYISDYIKNL